MSAARRMVNGYIYLQANRNIRADRRVLEGPEIETSGSEEGDRRGAAEGDMCAAYSGGL